MESIFFIKKYYINRKLSCMYVFTMHTRAFTQTHVTVKTRGQNKTAAVNRVEPEGESISAAISPSVSDVSGGFKSPKRPANVNHTPQSHT